MFSSNPIRANSIYVDINGELYRIQYKPFVLDVIIRNVRTFTHVIGRINFLQKFMHYKSSFTRKPNGPILEKLRDNLPMPGVKRRLYCVNSEKIS